MTRIFNTVTKSEIRIDETLDWIQITPLTYIEPTHIKIEIEGFFLGQHANTCIDCKSFIDAMGTDSNDWFIEYNFKKYKINTKGLGLKDYGSNQIKHIVSEYENGTFITLSVMELNIDDLSQQLDNAEKEEDYLKCSVYRDLISEAKK
jgi:hypothetical protein